MNNAYKHYESRITPELKHILEYPGFAAAPAEAQFAQSAGAATRATAG